jgi:hypothetical protein
MSIELNHTIIPALQAGPEWGHFVPVKTANGVTLDF